MSSHAATIAPLEFTSLGWAFVRGYLVGGDAPDLFVIMQALLIAVSGLIIVSIERRESGREKMQQ